MTTLEFYERDTYAKHISFDVTTASQNEYDILCEPFPNRENLLSLCAAESWETSEEISYINITMSFNFPPPRL